jgi:hypothetical protein
MEPSAFTVHTSAGQMEARWGWHGWISLTTPRSLGSSHAAKRLVEHRDELEELLVGFGLSVTESRRIAHDLWAKRPDGAPAEEGPEPERSPALLVAAAVILLAIAALVLLISAA